MNGEILINMLNRLLRKDSITQELLQVTGKQMDATGNEIAELEQQKYTDTATWGIDLFEKELDITTIKSKPLDERRSLIMAKWRGVGTLTLDLIRGTVSAYTGCDADVRFTGRIMILVDAEFGKKFNVRDLYWTIYEIRPAHLAFDVVYRYTKPMKTYLGAYSATVNRIKVYPHTVHDYRTETAVEMGAFSKVGSRVKVYPFFIVDYETDGKTEAVAYLKYFGRMRIEKELEQ